MHCCSTKPLVCSARRSDLQRPTGLVCVATRGMMTVCFHAVHKQEPFTVVTLGNPTDGRTAAFTSAVVACLQSTRTNVVIYTLTVRVGPF